MQTKKQPKTDGNGLIKGIHNLVGNVYQKPLDSKARMTTSTRFFLHQIVLTWGPTSFGWENVITVIILPRGLARMS